jgi:hypothetical protein
VKFHHLNIRLSHVSLSRKSGLKVKVLESAGLVGGRTYNREGLFAWPVDLGCVSLL